MGNLRWWKTAKPILGGRKDLFGPGVIVKSSRGEFSYKEDSGLTYYTSSSSLYWCDYMEGKHYDWLRVKFDVGWVKSVTAQETIVESNNGKP